MVQIKEGQSKHLKWSLHNFKQLTVFRTSFWAVSVTTSNKISLTSLSPTMPTNNTDQTNIIISESTVSKILSKLCFHLTRCVCGIPYPPPPTGTRKTAAISAKMTSDVKVLENWFCHVNKQKLYCPFYFPYVKCQEQ